MKLIYILCSVFPASKKTNISVRGIAQFLGKWSLFVIRTKRNTQAYVYCVGKKLNCWRSKQPMQLCRLTTSLWSLAVNNLADSYVYLLWLFFIKADEDSQLSPRILDIIHALASKEQFMGLSMSVWSLRRTREETVCILGRNTISWLAISVGLPVVVIPWPCLRRSLCHLSLDLPELRMTGTVPEGLRQPQATLLPETTFPGDTLRQFPQCLLQTRII